MDWSALLEWTRVKARGVSICGRKTKSPSIRSGIVNSLGRGVEYLSGLHNFTKSDVNINVHGHDF